MGMSKIPLPQLLVVPAIFLSEGRTTTLTLRLQLSTLADQPILLLDLTLACCCLPMRYS